MLIIHAEIKIVFLSEDRKLLPVVEPETGVFGNVKPIAKFMRAARILYFN